MSYLDSRQAARRRRRPWRRWPLDATGLRQARGVALSQGLVGGGPWAQPARLLGGRGGISLGPVRRPAQGIGVPGGGGGGGGPPPRGGGGPKPPRWAVAAKTPATLFAKEIRGERIWWRWRTEVGCSTKLTPKHLWQT
jgi:hypothetical protein